MGPRVLLQTTAMTPLLALWSAVALILLRVSTLLAFTVAPTPRISTTKSVGNSLVTLNDKKNDDGDMSKEVIVKYRNVATKFLGNFMQDKGSAAAAAAAFSSSAGNQKQDAAAQGDPLADIDWNAPKLKAGTLNMETLAAVLDAELYEKEWFVTGRVNPIYFAESFRFEDPDVKLDGIEAYARGVYKLFDQETSRAEIISTVVVNNEERNKITCTWRLSGKVSIGPAGLTIKPYIVYTDFTVDPTSGLIVLQQDRFDLPQWDILLSALFPFLIGKVRFKVMKLSLFKDAYSTNETTFPPPFLTAQRILLESTQSFLSFPLYVPYNHLSLYRTTNRLQLLPLLRSNLAWWSCQRFQNQQQQWAT
jgi:hypothetical protein